VVALAAAEGRSAVFLDAGMSAESVAAAVIEHNVGAVLTQQALSPRLPDGALWVGLDDAPQRATINVDGTSRTIDLTTHVALDLEGDPEVPGAEGEAVRCVGAPTAVLTHRTLLDTGRGLARSLALTASDRFYCATSPASPFGLIHGFVTPLVAGLEVIGPRSTDPVGMAAELTQSGSTVFVGNIDICRALVASGALRHGTSLRAAVCGPAAPDEVLRRAWVGATGIPLWQGVGA
jgi:acyl-coenzyme A synthetase/AMP-(fatty) acid ligase